MNDASKTKFDEAKIAAKTVNALKKSIVIETPYKYIIVDNFLDIKLFNSMRDEDISKLLRRRNQGRVNDGTPQESNRYAIDIDDDFARKFGKDNPISLVRDLLGKMTYIFLDRFKSEIYQKIDQKKIKFNIATEFIDDRRGYELLPHPDAERKLITVLIYVADDDSDPSIGTEIYALKENWKEKIMSYGSEYRFPRVAFDHVSTIPYRPNTAFIFAPTKLSFHGVSQLKTPARRRLIQHQIILT